MTTLNNYDQSSTGTSLECTVFYDTSLSRRMFEDNFQIMQHESYSKHTVAYYIDNGNVQGPDSIEFKVNGNTENLIKYAKESLSGYEEIVIPNEKDLTDIKHDISYDLKPTVLNYEELNKYDLKDTGIEFVPYKALERVEIRGYSQGDYALVFYCPEDLEAVWGRPPAREDLKQEFQRLFYDAPIYACFTINGEEHSVYEYPDWEDYEFKREEWLAYLADKTGIAIEILETVCPKEPGY